MNTPPSYLLKDPESVVILDNEFKKNVISAVTSTPESGLFKDYLGVPQTVAFYQENSNTIAVDQESRITVPCSKIIDFLKKQIQAEYNQNVSDSLEFQIGGMEKKYSGEVLDFQRFAGTLMHVWFAENQSNPEDKAYTTIFNPASGPKEKLITKFESFDKDERIKIENNFLSELIYLLHSANFKAMSQQEFDFATNPAQDFLFTMPVAEDWSQLDSDLMKNFYLVLKDSENIAEKPEFAKHCLVFWRGVGVKYEKDKFLLQKADRILYRIVSTLKSLAGIQKSTKQQPQNVHPHSGSIHGLKTIQRKTLTAEDCSFSGFFNEQKIQEPTFEELVLVYRKKQNKEDKNTENPHSIHISRFYNVQMKDLKMIFPAKKIGKNMADYFYYLLVLSWILTGLFKFYTALANSTYIDEVILALLLILLPFLLKYFTRTIISYRASRRCQSKIQNTLEKNSLNCNLSLYSYIQESARTQQFKEVIIAYYILWKWKDGMTKKQLDVACEYYVKAVWDISINFRVDEAIKELKKLGLITKNEDQYFIKDLPTTNQILFQKLIHHLNNASFLN